MFLRVATQPLMERGVGEEVKNIEIKIKLGYYSVGISLDRCKKFRYITVVLNFVFPGKQIDPQGNKDL
jgi:hypothetical protein